MKIGGFLLVCLSVLICKTSCGPAWNFYEDYRYTLSAGSTKNGHISCSCGSSRQLEEYHINVTVAMKLYTDVFSDKLMESNNFQNYPEDVKRALMNCRFCEVSFTKCYGNKNDTDYYCTKNSADFLVSKNLTHPQSNNIGRGLIEVIKSSSERYPQMVDLLKGGSLREVIQSSSERYPQIVYLPMGKGQAHKRNARQAESCVYPSNLETADLNCIIYPSSVKCRQRCAFGYTLDSGIEARMQCKFSENRWRPTGFKECQPFVDCSVTLTSGGSARCSTPVLNKEPQCHISCIRYEDKDDVRERSHTCDINGKWNPELPFCAVSGSGMYLAAPPHARKHIL